MPFFLAIDAGGTKAEYILADETRVLARTRGGSIKRMRVDARTAEENLRTALQELSLAAQIDFRKVDVTCIGTAGERVPLVTDWLHEQLTAAVGGVLLLVGDVDIALNAVFEEKPGALVLAGTGSNVAVRNKSGELFTGGGWGPLLGDSGSGIRIASDALRAIYAELDGGRETPLLWRVLEHWNLRSPDELIEYVHGQPAPDIATLASVVAVCAGEGDSLSHDVLCRQGELLGATAVKVLWRSGLRSDMEVEVAFAGSILQHVKQVRNGVQDVIRATFPDARFHAKAGEPVLGALWRARNHTQHPVFVDRSSVSC